ncbi:MAG: AMP-binding protein [Desulfomonile tiedjei]|uniref:AMP-binding protein n=1 Tax=Desulfomonile tiedjei TaxID=2358 RepID=A0A9D6V6V6_9BACT|nr:AMP-binding protein [Desulfomonile tiedjei]
MSAAGKEHYEGEINITDDLTLPKLLVQQARKFGEAKVAMREKEFGIWSPVTWKDYLENVKEITLGLIALGLEPGDKVIMIGDNRPEALWTEMAAMCGGGIGVWLFQDCLMDEVKYIVDHSDSKFYVAEGQEEVDKALAIRDECPKLKRIIWDDPKGMRHYDDPMLVSLEEVRKLGREKDKQDPGLFDKLVERGQGKDVCLLFYTSGTTSVPKGALLTHYNMLTMGRNLMRVDPCTPSDDFVSYLPFAWIGEQMMSISCGLQIGFTINFPEEPEIAQQNVREIGPHVMFAPPRLYEQMTRTIQVKQLDATWLKRMIYSLAMKIGYATAEMKFEKKAVPFYWNVLRAFANWTCYKKIRDHLGLSHVRHAYTGGAAMGPDHFRFFHAIGVNLKQIYGQTEIAGISVVHRDDDIKFDTVGTPIPETQVRITETDEIISTSPSVFVGYYKMPEETEKTLKDGWLYSGDTGFIDEDGHLVVFDRSKDVMILSDNRKFSPQFLEARLKFSPYIREALIVGHQRPHVASIICIDYNSVGKWAEDNGINYTSYPELSQIPQVYNLVEKAIREVNRTLPDSAKINRFANLYKEFDADDDELTRTRKIRRAFVENRYKNIIDALYSEMAVLHMETNITYEDGRVVEIKTDIRLQDVGEGGGKK